MQEFTKEQFAAQRSARRGTANPERMDMPVWRWLVRTGDNAFVANQQFGCPGPFDDGWTGPGWCFDRMGCTKTVLPDGRVVRIAGEHEDFYDPDFYIYNDVIVLHTDGAIDIYGYPEDVFPPTDFHSATLDEARGCIWIVGGLGYDGARRPGETQVLRLALDTWEVAAAPTTGEAPGWIHSHQAWLTADGSALVVSRGTRHHHSGDLIDQTDDWSLDLDALEWTRQTQRGFHQWSVRRGDGAALKLLEMSTFAFERRYPEHYPAASAAESWFDVDVFERLYVPPVAHTREPDVCEDVDDDEAWWDNTRTDRVRLHIGACVVRYHEGPNAIEIKVEGTLDAAVEAALRDDLVAKLTALQRAPCEAELVWEQ